MRAVVWGRRFALGAFLCSRDVSLTGCVRATEWLPRGRLGAGSSRIARRPLTGDGGPVATPPLFLRRRHPRTCHCCAVCWHIPHCSIQHLHTSSGDFAGPQRISSGPAAAVNVATGPGIRITQPSERHASQPWAWGRRHVAHALVPAVPTAQPSSLPNAHTYARTAQPAAHYSSNSVATSDTIILRQLSCATVLSLQRRCPPRVAPHTPHVCIQMTWTMTPAAEALIVVPPSFYWRKEGAPMAP